MRIGNWKLEIILLALLLSVSSVLPAGTFAQQTGDSKVSISPTLFEISVKPGDIIEKTMKVINNSNITQAYKMELDPFVGNELGQAKIVPDDPTFTLKDWLKISPLEFTLAAQKNQDIKFTITVPKDAEPGGQYGSILAMLNNKEDISGTGAVVRSKVGTLLLVAIAGDVNYLAYVKEFSAGKMRYEHSPITFNTRIHNTGTVHIKPKGFITLTDMFGHKVGSLDFEQKNIFPGSDRTMTQDYTQPLKIGRYTATLNVLYGEKGDQLSSKLVFYVLPLWFIILCIVVLLLIILFFIYRKRQKQKIAKLLKAARNPRPVRRLG